MTTDRWLAVAAVVAFLGGVYLAGWVHYRCPRWQIGCTCTDERPTVAQEIMQGIFPEPVHIESDEWDRLDPDAAADQLIAEWHGEPQERTVTPDVWDEWWAGLDGLDRELILVRHVREREERLWAELLAETRELCAA